MTLHLLSVWWPPHSGCHELLSFSALAVVDLNCVVNVPSPDLPGSKRNRFTAERQLSPAAMGFQSWFGHCSVEVLMM